MPDNQRPASTKPTERDRIKPSDGRDPEYERAWAIWLDIDKCKAAIKRMEWFEPNGITEEVLKPIELARLNDELQRLMNILDGDGANEEHQSLTGANEEHQSLTAPESAIPKSLAAPEGVIATRRTLWDVVTPHIVETMQGGQYATAKELFNILEKRAGPDSPFDKGVGNNRESLFVRETSQTLSLKTLQNNWQELLTAAKK